MPIKKYFLVFFGVTVMGIGALYGVNPAGFAQKFLGVMALDVNLAHILRAVMGLYIAFGLFLIYAARSDKHRDTAALATVIFSVGLLSGRILSYFADGTPAPLLQLYVAIELAAVPVSYWVYRLRD